LTAGTITLNTFTLTCSVFSSSNSNARTLAFGTGNITLTGSGATIWSTSTATNLVVTGTPTVNSTYSGSTGTRLFDVGFTAGATEANSISVNVTAGSDALSLYGLGLRDVNLTGFSGIWGAAGGNKTMYGSLTLGPTATIVSAGFGTITFAATSGTKTISTNSTVIDGANFTINAPGATYRLTGNVALGAGRTFTFTAGTLDLDGKTLTTGVFASTNSNARTVAFGTGNITVTGNNTAVFNTAVSTNLSVTGTPVINSTYAGGTGTRTIAVGPNTGSVAEAIAISVNVTAGTDIASVSGVGLGSVNFTGFSGTWNGAGNKTIYGNLTLSPTMSFSAGAGTITFAATSGTKTITSNGVTIDNAVVFDGVGGTFRFADALTLGSTRAFTITNGTVRLKAGTTNTVGSFTTGAGTTQRFLQSDTPGSSATISDASGANTATYLTIQDTTATGGATWTALLSSNNVDAGGNSGWNFGDYASSGLSRGVGLYAGAQGLWGGNSGLWGGFSGLRN
jgi:hypothetical protein